MRSRRHVSPPPPAPTSEPPPDPPPLPPEAIAAREAYIRLGVESLKFEIGRTLRDAEALHRHVVADILNRNADPLIGEYAEELGREWDAENHRQSERP
jgi:hypothetical protein